MPAAFNRFTTTNEGTAMLDDPIKLIPLLRGATAVKTGQSADVTQGRVEERTFQASVSGTGSVSATVVVEVSNDNNQFLPLATFTISGTGSATDGFTSLARWGFIRAKVTAISGTGASVDCTAGV